MSPRIDEEGRREISSGYLIVFLGIAVLVGTWIAFQHGNTSSIPLRQRTMNLVLLPWHVAEWKTVADGVNEFSGKPAAPVTLFQTAMALGGMLLLGVILPVSIVLLVRRRAADRTEGSKEHPKRARDAVFLISAALSGTLVIAVGVSIVIRMNALERTARSVMISHVKDEMINEMNEIALRSRAYGILPRQMSGGDGSLAGFTLPSQMQRTEYGTYAIQSVNDSVIAVKGTSHAFPTATIATHIERNGKISMWTYSGEFW